MTERSSCKSFFKNYLRYRIKEQKINLILCCVLNVFALPLFALAQKKGFDNQFSDFYMYGKICSMISGAALIVLAIVGVTFSFDFYHKKNLTDTIGALPLSYKQRFWGDFLAGYITNVAPVIPCGIVSVFIFAGTQGKFDDLWREAGEQITVFFSMASLGIATALALFFTVTFAYLLSVLVTSGCGKLITSVMFSVIGAVALPCAAAGFVGCFANSILGIDTSKYTELAVMFFPPAGSLRELSGAIGFLGAIDFLNFTRVEDYFMVFKPLYIVYLVVFGAAISAGAFFLGKFRKQENTGKAFLYKPMFYVISLLFSSALVADVMSLIYRKKIIWTVLLIAVIAGAVAFLICELIYRPKRKDIFKGIVYCAAAIGVSIGITILFDKTGSFGLRYLCENPDKIEYLKVDDMTVTDKADIEKFMKLQNETLKRNADILEYGESYGFAVEYKTTSGKTIKRVYDKIFVADDYTSPIGEMNGNMRSLSGYGKYFFGEIDGMIDDLVCDITEKNDKIQIPDEKLTEFIGILREEASEKYDPYSEPYALAKFSGRKILSFTIQPNYEKTIEFLDGLDEKVEIDPEEVIIKIIYDSHDKNNESLGMDVYIKNKYKDDELVKELMQLFGKRGDGGDADDCFVVLVSNSIVNASYYVPKENAERVLEIVTELALRDFE